MEWIKCSEKMPELNQDVLIYDSENKHVFSGVLRKRHKEEDFYDNRWGYPTSNITHWTNLPQPPKD